MLINFQKVLEKLEFHPKGIIHLGAYVGEEYPEYLKAGISNCIFVEANPILAQQCRLNVGNDKTFEYLLHEQDNLILPFNLIYSDDRQNLGCSSIFELDKHAELYPWCRHVETIYLGTKTLNTIFKDNNLNKDNFDFINMDLQGAEVLALKGASDILPNIKGIMTEFAIDSLYKNGCQLNDLDDFLVPLGFERILTEFIRPEWGDCLMVRR